MRARGAGLIIGLIFGISLSWSGMTSPDVIRGALLFEHGYLFLFMASAVAVASAGSWAVRRLGFRALFTGRRVTWSNDPPARRHIVGSLIFGIGWGVADACPGPIATQVGQGITWGLWTLTGVIIGIALFLRRRHAETEPATDPAPNRLPDTAEPGQELRSGPH
jgi:uncharacterized membrane protein YedE/YeeE